MWDGGSDIVWTYPGEETWFPLKTAQFPGFAAQFVFAAPEFGLFTTFPGGI
jgi:hypothetical protein